MIYNALESRASLENPSTSLLQAFGAEKLPSGVSVNENTSLKLSVAFACIRVISETLSTTSCKVYERLGGFGAGRREARDHPAFELVHVRANAEMSAQALFEVAGAHVAGWGNGYLNPEYRAGQVVGLWPLLPDRTIPKRRPVSQGAEAKVKILESQINGRPVEYTPPGYPGGSNDRRYLHVPYLGFDGLKGYSVLGMARRVTGYGLAMQEYGERFFGQGAHFPYVVKSPEFLDREKRARIRESLEETQAGLAGAHRLAVLDAGMDVAVLGMPHDDAEWLESSKFNVLQVARFFRMQPHKIQSMENATFSNIEMQAIEHVTDTIRPYAVRMEQVFNWGLFQRDERGRFYVEFDLDSLMRGDSVARGDFYTKLWTVGSITQNEIRAKENMNPLDDPLADKTFVPLNMVPTAMAGEIAAGNEEPPPEQDREVRTSQAAAIARQRLQRAHQRLFAAAGHRLVDKEVRALLRILTKALAAGSRWEEVWLLDLRSLREKMEPSILRELAPLLGLYADALTGALKSETGAERDVLATGQESFQRAYANAAARRYSAFTETELAPLIGDRDESGIRNLVGEWKDWRADQWAAEESVRSGGAITRTALAAAGFVTYIWITVGESCALCDSLNGKVVGREDAFASEGDIVENENGGGHLRVSRKILHPPLHVGRGKGGVCDCVIGVA